MLPKVKSLSRLLPEGADGGTEFARLMDLLLISEAKRSETNLIVFNDAAGDFAGLDSFGSSLRRAGTTGYQYKFYKSPLTDAHRNEIKKTVALAATHAKQLKLKKLVIVTPDDLLESATRKNGGDVSWFIALGDGLPFGLEHLGHKKIVELMVNAPSVALFYYPELVKDGAVTRRSVLETRKLYNDNLAQTYRNIEFVGMSVYKADATRGIPMESIYIPLMVSSYSSTGQHAGGPRVDPTPAMRSPGRFVILGDPGSGKSTLLKFLLLSGISSALQLRYSVPPDQRLPVLVTLRKYADAIKQRPNLPLLTFILETTQADFSLTTADLTFFEFYLKTGHAMVLFDGLDELPSPEFKEIVRNRIQSFSTSYPNNTIVVTSRIVGYDSPFKFPDDEFTHLAVADLELPQIEGFVQDWYKIRIDNQKERDDNVRDLIRIVRDEENAALRGLAKNPLLLTIIALVHRIDAVLPDERVVLYQKCTETLLNTWHTWKFRDAIGASRGRIERRNRRRIEAIAHWMHLRSGVSSKKERAVASHQELRTFLAEYITAREAALDPAAIAEESADEFLEFVKKKAGLLIEVGDGQYSFVHLTFQEYLTASFIITEGETEGIEAIWRSIQRHVADPRWHEVIRLLTGELKAERSQDYLVDKLIEAGELRNEYHVANLLGGILVDGVIAAVERSSTIMACILRNAIHLRDTDHVGSLIRVLGKLCDKSPMHEEAALNAMSSICGTLKRPIDRLAAALTGTALNWPAGHTCRTILTETKRLSPAAQIYEAIYCGAEPDLLNSSMVETFANLQYQAIFTSPELNAFAAMLVRFNFSLNRRFGWETLWRSLFYTLLTAPRSGPLTDFSYNLRAIYRREVRRHRAESTTRDVVLPIHPRSGTRSTPQKPAGLYDHFLRAITAANKASIRSSGQRSAFVLVQDRGPGNLRIEGTIIQRRRRAKTISPDGDGSAQALLGSPQWVAAYLDFIVNALNLTPAAQWRECIQATIMNGATGDSSPNLSASRLTEIVANSPRGSYEDSLELGSLLLYLAAESLYGETHALDIQLLEKYTAQVNEVIPSISLEVYKLCEGVGGNASRFTSLLAQLDDAIVSRAVQLQRKRRPSQLSLTSDLIVGK
jgi:hypothetical protein